MTGKCVARFVWPASIVLIALFSPNGMAQSAPFECDPAHAILIKEPGTPMSPVLVLPGGKRFVLGDIRIFLQGARSLIAERTRDGSMVWKAAARDSEKYEILGCSETRIYVRSWREIATTSMERFEPLDPLRIEAVDVSSGRLRDFARIAPPHGKTPQPSAAVFEVWDLTCDQGIVYVLSAHRTERVPVSDQLFLKYKVSAFEESSGRQVWEREFDPSPDAPTVDIHFFEARRYGTGIRPLSMAGRTLLVCAGSQQPLLALDSRSGAERWRLDAVWEYQRGYTSFVPYSVYFTRFGISPDEYHSLLLQPDPIVRAAEEARIHSELLRRFRLFAGPISVPFDGGYRSFLAVGDCDRHWPEETAVCDIYEVDDKGRPVSILRLPRPPRSDSWTISGESVQLICRGGGIARFRPTYHGNYGGREPEHDALGRLEWFLETRAVNWTPVVWHENGPWLTTGIAREDPMAFNEQFAAFIPTGGWVETPLDKTFHLPLALLDLRTRNRHVLDLTIPLGKPIPPPTNNCLTIGSKVGTDAGNVYHAHGSYGLSVTDLEWVGSQLEITVSVEDGRSYRLRFKDVCPR